jgi:hypothetical protein
MASNDVFHFGTTAMLSGNVEDSQSVPAHIEEEEISVEEAEGSPMSWLPSQTVSLPTYSPEGWIDDRPSHDVLEDEDHSGENSQPGGISLSVDPTEVEGPQPMNSTPNGVALAYAPPLASHWGIPPTEAPFDNLPNPFDNSLSALSLQGTNNTHPVFAMTTASEGLLQHALTVLGNANALQHFHNLSFDEASDFPDDELPAVNDYQAVNDVCRFIDHWAVTGVLESGADLIGRAAANVRGWDRPETVTREELQGDQYDIQGINWEKLDTTREKARSARTKLCAKKAKSQVRINRVHWFKVMNICKQSALLNFVLTYVNQYRLAPFEIHSKLLLSPIATIITLIYHAL